jgi:hypothetical protein
MTMGHVLRGLDVTPTADSATFLLLEDGKRVRLDLAPTTRSRRYAATPATSRVGSVVDEFNEARMRRFQ